MSDSETVTERELAELFACTTGKIRQLAVLGITVRGDRAQYLKDLSTRNYVTHLREAAGGRTNSAGSGLNLPDETARLKASQREYYDLRNEETKRNVVRLEQIRPVWQRKVLAVRAAILAIPTIARLRMQLDEKQAEELAQIIREQLLSASLTETPPTIEVKDEDAA